MRRLLYLLMLLPAVISIGIQLIAPSIAQAAASDITLGFNYDDTPSNINNMQTDITAGGIAGIGSNSTGVGFSNSQVIAQGGIFGSGTILPYTKVVGGNYYEYSYDFYCTPSGDAQTSQPTGTDPYYKLQISTLLNINSNFSTDTTEAYEGGLTDIQYTPSSAPNTQGKSWEVDNNSGYVINSGLLGSKDSAPITSCLTKADIPADWRATWTPALPGFIEGQTVLSPQYDQTGTPALENLVDASVDQKKDVSSWNSILSKQGGGSIGDPTATSGPDAGDTSGTGGNGAPAISCSVTGLSIINPLNWLLCGAVQGMSDIIGFADSAITSQLAVGTNGASTDQPIQIFCKDYTGSGSDSGCQAYHSAWDQFRDIALGLMAIAGLVALIAQAMGFEFLDAYTIRKVLPRILIAVVAISLSWQLMALFVQFGNDLGYGVRSLIYFPFTQAGFSSVKISLDNLGANGVSLLTGLAGLSLGFFGLLALAASGALALLIAFFVLVLRQIAIIMLIILAPIGILAYVLPNTQNVFKLWWDSFSKAILMFPLIVALIATGHVFAAIASSAAADNNQTDPILYSFAAFVAYFAPYFLIPATFKFAGGAVRQIGGFVNDRGKGGFDRLSKMRSQTIQNRMHRAAEGNLYRASNPVARRFNTATRGIANAPKAGTTPWKWRSRFQAGLATAELSEMAEYMEKNEAFKAIAGNDDYLQATMKSMGGGSTENDWRRYLSSHNYSGRSLEAGIAMIRAAKRETNDDVFEKAAVVANASTGTGWKETGAGGMYAAINDVAGDDRGTAVAMLAQMRERANQARRQDLGGASVNKQIGWMNDMYDGKMTAEGATRATARRAWETNSAGSIIGQRGDSVKQMTPVIMDEVRDAYASGNQLKIDRTLGKLADLQDVMNYASPEVKEILTDDIFAQPLGVPEYKRYEKDEYITDAAGNRLPERNQDNSIKYSPSGEVVYQAHRRGEQVLDASGNRVPVLDANGNQQISHWNLRNEIQKRQRGPEEAAPEFFNSRKEHGARSEDDIRGLQGGSGTPPTGPPTFP